MGGLICFFIIAVKLFAQDEKPELMLSIKHVTENNSLQYLKVQAQLKAQNKLQPLKDLAVQIYLDSVDAPNLIGKIKTDEKGSAQTIVPASLKNLWSSSDNHKFIAIAKANPKEEETTAVIAIAKAKIEIDTLNEDGKRSVTAKVFSYNNDDWIPAKDVEVKIGVERLGGSLKIGDDETYTTDSLGQVTVEFILDSLPANDTNGNIVLIARVEDNDQFGNLSVEKAVPWGKFYQQVSVFGKRSLWAARFRAPLWLLFMAYSIVGVVWGVIIYLFFLVFRIKRLGKNKEKSDEEKLPGNDLAVQHL